MIKKGQCIVLPLLLAVLFFTMVSNAQTDETSTLLIGDYVLYGQYYGEPILWRVVSFDQERNPILYSEEILCYKAFDSADSGVYNGEIYNENPNATATDIANALGSSRWRNSTIRAWLNSNQEDVYYPFAPPSANALAKETYAYDEEAGFLSHFSESEYSALVPVSHKTLLINNPEVSDFIVGGTLYNDLDSTYGTLTYGNYDEIRYEDVTDKVFLLSSKEFTNWIVNKGWTVTAKPSLVINKIKPHKKEFALWLRTVGGRPDNPFCVYADLKGEYYECYNDYTASEADFGIRPAICIDGKRVKRLGGTGQKNSPFKLRILPFTEIEEGEQSTDGNIRREAFYQYVIKLYERLTYQQAPNIADNPFIDSANEYVIKAFQLDLITNDKQNYFEPLKIMNQQEIKAVVDRLLNKIYEGQAIELEYTQLNHPEDYFPQKDVESLMEDIYKAVKSQIGGQYKISAFDRQETLIEEDLIWIDNQVYLPAEKIITKLDGKTSGLQYNVNDGVYFTMELKGQNGEVLNLYTVPDWNQLIIQKNGKELPWLSMSSTPLIIDGIYMVPIEAFEQGFNLEVEVDMEKRVVKINYK